MRSTTADKPKETLADHRPGNPYFDMSITLLAAAVVPIYLYGPRVAILLGIAVAAAFVLEFFCNRLAGKRRIPKGDVSFFITAMLTVFLMPATVPLWMPVAAVVFALCIAKHPFGGTNCNIFNPAAAGVAFCVICWPEYLTKYPLPFGLQSPWDISNVQYGTSLASVLRVGGTPQIDFIDVSLGKFAGPTGATCVIVILCCMAYLLLRKKISAHVVFAGIVTFGLIVFLFPRVSTGRLSSLVYELASGAFLFGMTFMAGDPAVLPKTHNGRIFYGVILGGMNAVLCYFGAQELGFVFAILLANVFVHSCDRYAAFLKAFVGRLWQRTVSAVKSRKKGGIANA